MPLLEGWMTGVSVPRCPCNTEILLQTPKYLKRFSFVILASNFFKGNDEFSCHVPAHIQYHTLLRALPWVTLTSTPRMGG